MERTIKGKGTEPVNNGDKAWVTVSMTINLGSYESIKVESGFSQTLKPKEDPLELMNWMQDEITPVISGYVDELRMKFNRKPVKE